MTQDHRTKPDRQPAGRIWLLVLIQVVLGITLTVTGTALELRRPLEFLPRVPAFALILAQTCLIGLWAAMSHRLWRVRLLALGPTIAYLEVQLAFAMDDDDFGFLVTIATLTLTGVLWLIRIYSADLQRFPKGTITNHEGLKFSIRGLMLFTAAVAVLITLAKQFRQLVDGPEVWVIAIWGLCFVVASLAAIWAMLGVGKPMLRSLVVLTVSLALGALFGYVIDEGMEAYFYIMTIMVLQSLFLLGSLAVLRGEGYRFVGRTPHSNGEAGR